VERSTNVSEKVEPNMGKMEILNGSATADRSIFTYLILHRNNYLFGNVFLVTVS